MLSIVIIKQRRIQSMSNYEFTIAFDRHSIGKMEVCYGPICTAYNSIS